MSLSGIDTSRLSVLLDLRQPQAYLALHPAAAMAGECDIQINWLPVVVPPLKVPSEPTPEDDRGIRHRRSRAQALAREIETYAAVQGLVLEEYYREPDPTALHLAWLWVRERFPGQLFPFLAEAFRAYWALELDVSSDDAVTSFLDGFALATEFPAWRAAAGATQAASLADGLEERGLTRAPCYLVENEVFVGRQHLPMIRWILDGRSGRGPI